MWFDAQAALAELTGAERPVLEPRPPATIATSATQTPEAHPRVASVARVATPQPRRAENPPSDRADGLHPDAGAYFDFLRLHGPHTYGAAASTLEWGATRAWQAEARLRAAGLVRYGPHGKAHPISTQDATPPEKKVLAPDG